MPSQDVKCDAQDDFWSAPTTTPANANAATSCAPSPTIPAPANRDASTDADLFAHWADPACGPGMMVRNGLCLPIPGLTEGMAHLAAVNAAVFAQNDKVATQTAVDGCVDQAWIRERACLDDGKDAAQRACHAPDGKSYGPSGRGMGEADGCEYYWEKGMPGTSHTNTEGTQHNMGLGVGGPSLGRSDSSGETWGESTQALPGYQSSCMQTYAREVHEQCGAMRLGGKK